MNQSPWTRDLVERLFQMHEKKKQAERALEVPPPQLDAFGRDSAAEKATFVASLDGVGYDHAKLMYARMTLQDEPRKSMWMEEWLAGQERALRESNQARISRHETITRWIAGGALLVAFLALVVSGGAWLYPRSKDIATVGGVPAAPSATGQGAAVSPTAKAAPAK